MTIQEIEQKANFLIQCKVNYINSIRPARIEDKTRAEYKKLVEIATLYFEQGFEERFAEYFGEYQYLINLWAAHLLLEYGKPSENLKERCLEIIVRYSETPLSPELALQEKMWLQTYREKD
jgi:hypothetical protein